MINLYYVLCTITNDLPVSTRTLNAQIHGAVVSHYFLPTLRRIARPHFYHPARGTFLVPWTQIRTGWYVTFVWYGMVWLYLCTYVCMYVRVLGRDGCTSPARLLDRCPHLRSSAGTGTVFWCHISRYTLCPLCVFCERWASVSLLIWIQTFVLSWHILSYVIVRYQIYLYRGNKPPIDAKKK